MKLCILATLISFSDLIYAAEKTLQSIENLDDDELRTDEGNEFKLIQLNTGCKIEARFFLSYQNILSSYIFQNHALKSATERVFRYQYEKDHEGSLMHVTHVYQYSSAHLNIQDAQVKKDFMRYKALFPTHYLTLCNSN